MGNNRRKNNLRVEEIQGVQVEILSTVFATIVLENKTNKQNKINLWISKQRAYNWAWGSL
jgi:hypothetical protein